MKTIPVQILIQRCFLLPLLLLLISKPAAAQNRPMGVDVSSYQGASINWTAYRNEGIFFAWAKATEGPPGYFTDPDFVDNEVNAKAAGMLIGAYHYAHPSLDTNITGANSADTEAQFFWSKISPYVIAGGNYLVPMLDWEDPDVSSPNQTKVSMSAWANEWCNDISNYARANGVIIRPVIYTGQSYGSTWLNSSVTNWPCWIAAYPYCTVNNGVNQCGSPTPQTSNPGGNSPWPTWNIWQYGDTNYQGGDADVFNGTTNQFLSIFLVGSINAPHVALNPASLTVPQGTNVTFTVAVTGTVPLIYNWQLDGKTLTSVTNYDTNSVSFSLTNVQVTDAGDYTVQISNSSGSVVTAPAFLSVVEALSNAPGSSIAPAGLVDWWPANGNAIDIVSGYNAVPNSGFSYTNGESGEAFHFDGITGYLTITNARASVAVPWTASMWVYRQSTTLTSSALISDGTNTLKLEQYMNGTNSHYVGMTKIGVADYVFSPIYIVPLNTWTHLTFVASGSTTTLYANGAQVATLAEALPLGRVTLGATDVTGTGYVDYLNGAMEQVMLFNKALTAAQVQSIYNTGAASLVAAPQFLNFSTGANGELTFSLEGLTGSKNITVYYSTNLPNWSVLTTLSAANGSNTFTVNPTNGAAFYRAIQP